MPDPDRDDQLEVSPAIPDWEHIPVDDDAEPDDLDQPHATAREQVDDTVGGL